jgi:glycosyltransferase involved in cell wall biosynthesis
VPSHLTIPASSLQRQPHVAATARQPDRRDLPTYRSSLNGERSVKLSGRMEEMSIRTLSVMMPVYNEERTLATIFRHVLARPEVGEVIAVDDGSTDHSWDIMQAFAGKDPRVRLLRQPRNLGKGAALRRAIAELSMPFALVQDADLEYDPRDYPLLLQPLLEGRADVVYGVRGFGGHTAYSFWFVVGNKIITLASNVLFNAYISDLETGYKVLRSELWKRLHLRGNRFDIEPDITARILRLGYRIHEVRIRYYARSRHEGKKITWRDGLQAVAYLMRMRVARKRSLFGTQYDYRYHRQRLEELVNSHPLLNDPVDLPTSDADHRRSPSSA